MINLLELEHVACDLCGAHEYKVRYKKPDTWLINSSYEFPVVECSCCGLVYLNPRPTVKSMAQFYPQNYHDNRNSDSFQRRYQIQSEYIPKLAGGSVLDIGCARGDWLNYIRHHSPACELNGCDLYSDRINYPFIFVSKALPDCSYPENKFDLITAWAVFEHLHAPMVYFKEVGRILKPGGQFIALVTNSESLYGRHAYTEDVPRHTYHFSRQTLQQYADKNGLILRELAYEDRLWDGSGRGTFYHAGIFLAGAKWFDVLTGRMNLYQRRAGRLGAAIDSFVFRGHWEAKMKRSGIMVATFEKPG